MIEFSNDLQMACHNSGFSPGWPTFKGKQGGVRVCVCVCHNPPDPQTDQEP